MKKTIWIFILIIIITLSAVAICLQKDNRSNLITVQTQEITNDNKITFSDDEIEQAQIAAIFWAGDTARKQDITLYYLDEYHIVGSSVYFRYQCHFGNMNFRTGEIQVDFYNEKWSVVGLTWID